MLAVAAGLAALVVAVFAASFGHGFVNIDDGLYVTENEVVPGGLTWRSLAWAFETFHTGNWHPLTWLSLMLDSELFGSGPRGYHLTNVVLHLAATLGLWAVLYRATSALWRSALVAALFAVHPLHVESVAWISERKDVLSAALAVATLAAYQRFASRTSAARYLLVVLAFALGLLAKPMLVTLPVILLAWDHWPLRRLGSWTELRARVVEKLPLFALSAVASAVTLIAQADTSVVALQHLPVTTRLAHALHSTGWYLAKTVWPSGLAAFYPYELSLPTWQIAAAGIVVLATTAAVWASRSGPLLVGWCWYLVMLLPVIGIVQVGAQARADRYTYLPLVGVFIMAAWVVPAVSTWPVPARRRLQILAGALACGAVLASAATARAQVEHWRDATALMQRAVAVTERNWFAHNALGRIRTMEGRLAEAETHLHEAVRLAPEHPDVRFNLGVLQADLQRWPLATENLAAAVRLRPGWPEAHYNLGRTLQAQGLLEPAAAQYSTAVELRPGYSDAHNNLAAVHLARGNLRGAEASAREAARLDPASPYPRLNLAIVYLYAGAIAQARQELEAARALGGEVPPEIARAFLERAAPRR